MSRHKPRLHEHLDLNPDRDLDQNPHRIGGLSLDSNPLPVRVNASYLDQDLDTSLRVNTTLVSQSHPITADFSCVEKLRSSRPLQRLRSLCVGVNSEEVAFPTTNLGVGVNSDIVALAGTNEIGVNRHSL